MKAAESRMMMVHPVINPGLAASRSLRLAQPARYRIKVQGWLEPDWSDWLEGLEITTVREAEAPPVTVLTGNLADQAALHGVLFRLYNMGLPLLSVELLPPPEPAPIESGHCMARREL